MKNLLFIIAFIPVIGFSQKLHKTDWIDYHPLTLNPIIFDPNMDSTIYHIEFLQDTINIYEKDEEAEFSSIDRKENFEQVFAIGVVGDFRISKNRVSVIIKTHHTNGEVKTFKYIEKIDKLKYYEDFKWSTYGTKGTYFWEYNRSPIKHSVKMKCSV